MITRRESQLLVFQDFFLCIYLFDGQFRLFSFSDSNTYSDAEISIISFMFWWTRNNFGVIFSFVYTLFALFTFHVLVAYVAARVSIFKILFFASF